MTSSSAAASALSSRGSVGGHCNSLPCTITAVLLLTLAARGARSFEDYYNGYGGYWYSGDPGNGFYNPWAFFFNFSDCGFGEQQQGLWQVKQYLSAFGYLPSAPSFSDVFDDPLRAAILSYQEFFHLNATGELDPSTVEHMVQPRCGVADLLGNSSSSAPGRNLYSFFPGNPVWPSSQSRLKYAFVSTSAVALDLPLIKKVFSRAFARWAEVSTLSFVEVDPNSEQPDITIGFYAGDHGDGEPFDGQLGTLAHAFSPTDGRFHLDAAEMWVASATDAAADNLLQSAAAVDLESVAVHEIGHLLGLGHSAVEGSIMYPTIKTRNRRVQLTQDDIAGIQALYGNNPNYNGTSTFGGGGGGGANMRDRSSGAAALAPPSAASAAAAVLVLSLPTILLFSLM